MNTIGRRNTTPAAAEQARTRGRSKAAATRSSARSSTTRRTASKQPKSKGWFGFGGPSKKELSLQAEVDRLQQELSNLRLETEKKVNSKVDRLEIQAYHAKRTINKLERDLAQQRGSLLKKVKMLRLQNSKDKKTFETNLQIKDVDMQMLQKEMDNLQQQLVKEKTTHQMKVYNLESSLQHVERERKTEHDRNKARLAKLQYALQQRNQQLGEKDAHIEQLEALHPARARIAKFETSNSKLQQLKQQKVDRQSVFQNSVKTLSTSTPQSSSSQQQQQVKKLQQQLTETKKQLAAAGKRIQTLEQQKATQSSMSDDRVMRDLYETKVRLKKAFERIIELEG